MSKHIITVCMGSSCFARGNDTNLAFLEDLINEKKLDAEIELVGARCEGKCATGPNITIDGVEYHEVDVEKLEEILSLKQLSS